MRGYIENSGFTNIHERKYKVPVWDWSKNRSYEEAGAMNMLARKEGVEGGESSIMKVEMAPVVECGLRGWR